MGCIKILHETRKIGSIATARHSDIQGPLPPGRAITRSAQRIKKGRVAGLASTQTGEGAKCRRRVRKAPVSKRASPSPPGLRTRTMGPAAGGLLSRARCPHMADQPSHTGNDSPRKVADLIISAASPDMAWDELQHTMPEAHCRRQSRNNGMRNSGCAPATIENIRCLRGRAAPPR